MTHTTYLTKTARHPRARRVAVWCLGALAVLLGVGLAVPAVPSTEHVKRVTHTAVHSTLRLLAQLVPDITVSSESAPAEDPPRSEPARVAGTPEDVSHPAAPVAPACPPARHYAPTVTSAGAPGSAPCGALGSAGAVAHDHQQVPAVALPHEQGLLRPTPGATVAPNAVKDGPAFCRQ
jgi:hypothetical protein